MPAMHAKRRDEHTAQELIAALRRLHVSSADLKDLIQLVQDFIEEDLNRRLDVIKASSSGRDLPREVLKRDLTNSGALARMGCASTAINGDI
jgi:hypothetical protein